ncbi:MAG: hypothetical protein ACK53L_04695, partial [Pirellulaceae bacterium]
MTTIGSVLAVDTSGSHFLRYGSAGSTILSMEAVLASGEAARMARTPWSGIANPASSTERLASEIGQLLWANRHEFQHLPWRGVARGCGYRIDQCIHP